MGELGTPPWTSLSLRSLALFSGRPLPPGAEAQKALLWPWLGGSSGQSRARLGCTAVDGPSVGLSCIHQHPGGCKHLTLAPFGRVTRRGRLVPWRLRLGRTGLVPAQNQVLNLAYKDIDSI